ncbi:lysophospholipid acyltransferase 5-like [Hypanus sabinus]|uniref:lysophospholipid acyltransferase 5-like n=1 Tax=Hypanus sabinus TaxID=79690 RepID=UPI0028C46334|nr:lysophospholipid acyltransferase 5-like [Hypanus sabinus]
MLKLMAESPLLSQLTSRAELRPLVYVVCQSFHWLFMGYSLLPFCLLSWEKWVPVYQSVYFLGHVIFFGNLLLLPLHRRLLLPRKRRKVD